MLSPRPFFSCAFFGLTLEYLQVFFQKTLKRDHLMHPDETPSTERFFNGLPPFVRSLPPSPPLNGVPPHTTPPGNGERFQGPRAGPPLPLLQMCMEQVFEGMEEGYDIEDAGPMPLLGPVVPE